MANFMYILMPLHEHYDSGFGATGNAFKGSADLLWDQIPEEGPLFNERLPMNFLYRHAIELFLKSTIVIIHRRLGLAYGPHPCDGLPHVLVRAEWKPIDRVHDIASLWSYVRQLFVEQKAFFDSVNSVDWTIEVAADKWFSEVALQDPGSTFFRYPDLRNPAADVPKAALAGATPDEFFDRYTQSSPGGIALAVQDQDGALVRGYYYTGDSLQALSEVLRRCSDWCYKLHAAMRSQLCGGR
jgi:hypothetical protein